MGSAGARSVANMVTAKGKPMGRWLAAKLMVELGLVSRQQPTHKYLRGSKEHVDIPNHLGRQFAVTEPNQVWCGDITYIWAQGKWHYLAVVLDLCTRRIVGWALSEKPDAELVIKALDMAYEQRGRPSDLLFHSDQGSQYASRLFRQRLWRYRMRQSMSRRGNCWDNAPQESFFGHMKDELAEKIPNWTCFADVQRSIDDWMDYYNNDRYQWDLAKLSPNERL